LFALGLKGALMIRRVLRTSVAALCTCFVVLPASAGAVTLGIGSQDPGMFSSPRFQALHITTARYGVAYDVATRRSNSGQLREFRAWYNGAQADGVSPLISFGADTVGSSKVRSHVPSVNEYTRAVKAFLKRFPKIKYYTAWNEPDFPYYKLSRNSRLAANYFNALYKVCGKHRTVLAGDVFLPATGPSAPVINHSQARLGAWLPGYIKGLHHRPAGWALHDYTEIRGRNTKQLRTLMRLTRGPIWLDETGGVIRRGHWIYKNQSAAAAGRDESYLLSLTKRYHRISRIYHYQWSAVRSAGWDSALLDTKGRPRSAYWVVLHWQHAHPARASH
jgi:hypothetical protein